MPAQEESTPQEKDLGGIGKIQRFAWLEEVVADNLDLLFPGLEIVASYPFRVTRDADVTIEADGAPDLITSVEEQLDLRDFNSMVRVELDTTTPDYIVDLLIRNLQIPSYLVYTEHDPIGMAGLMELTALERPDLKDAPFQPVIPALLSKPGGVLEAIRQDDLLLSLQ